jgi:small subunit ribosomal protein S16
MPVKIRLARKGRKKSPIYYIVVADSRAPRDGRYIEKVGQYNPTTNPASVELDFDKALDWLQKGAQPTDTCRAILSTKGVMMKKHLLEGVKKGAFSADEAETRFEKWLKEKDQKLNAAKDNLVKTKEQDAKKRLEAETKVKEERAALLAKKAAEEASRPAQEVEVVEETPVAEEAPVVEETVAVEEPAVAEEAPAAEPVAETETESTPAPEEKPE